MSILDSTLQIFTSNLPKHKGYIMHTVHCTSVTCVHEHISPLLGENPGIVNI